MIQLFLKVKYKGLIFKKVTNLIQKSSRVTFGYKKLTYQKQIKMNSIYINNKSFSFRWFMGNTTDNCKNACLENCQIVVRRDT